jgi:hypothetical protein
MSSAGGPNTVGVMKTPKRKPLPDTDESGSNMYSELRRRNERRARVAELLEDRRRRLEQIANARRTRTTRHAG